VDAVGVRHLPHEPRFPDARLTDDRHDLAMPGGGVPERLAQLFQFGVSPHESREPPGGRRMEPGAHVPGSRHLVYLDGCFQPLDRDRPEQLDRDEPLRQPQRVSGQQRCAGVGQLLHPGGKMRSLPHGRVVHAQVGADGADDDFAGVQA
jgi:hypothetical protein